MLNRSSKRARILTTSALLLAIGGIFASTMSAEAGVRAERAPLDGTGGPVPLTTAAKAARGVVMKDLVPGAGPCTGGFQLAGDDACTPGPDPAAPRVDVRYTDRGVESPVTYMVAEEDGILAADGSVLPLPASACGTSGPRVQALYVRPVGAPDRFAELAPSLRIWAMTADKVFARSAAKSGGVRHIRWVSDASCLPVFESVTVSQAGVDSLDGTIRELKRQGFRRHDRKYVIWMDAAVYCGMGTASTDDSTGKRNNANTMASYGRIDRGCWGGYTEAHELTHGLGGVQLSAPNSNGAYHCTDDSDRMCYAEGTSTVSQLCPAEEERLLDCGNDDYFNTAPKPGSYLATHWNVADSIFLSR